MLPLSFRSIGCHPVSLGPRRFSCSLGSLRSGPRKECERQVHSLGGRCEESVTQQTNYLIVGTFGSRDWAHTSFGRKIEKAVAYRRSGMGLAIISEDHWAGLLP